ncbi:GNAT family N-acetyltransferase [Allobranchiibius sp. CTAmp26]|uniref:GNAT family N-acetyltransferase n=1 Tax=Allobranchiibius sp. CTAmp26 TaxID=2815214 RepID=UPI001AA11A6F|nr:GNAT family N-acetyltransferase [Allobranchiibius sp. CTAmp26]MBO1756813.1 GNAT family N-acetyltransferase [Allobranchiibius sp. CTAmp26]
MSHQLPEDQQRFAAPAADSLPLSDGDPDRTSVAILAGDEPVGMFALDRGGYFRKFQDSPSAVLLRAFYVASDHQGHGYARAAVAAVPAFVREHLPGVDRVVLTVNTRNPTAIHTYTSGGFTDTGKTYLGGTSGPQHILELTL